MGTLNWDFRLEVARNISELVKSSGKTKAQIAKEMKIDNKSFCAYANGETIPTLENFKKLCEIFNCCYEDILGPSTKKFFVGDK